MTANYAPPRIFAVSVVLVLFALTAGRVKAAPPSNGETKSAAKEEPATNAEPKQRTIGIVLYPGFELLDVYGPVEMFGNLGPRMKVVMVAQEAGEVASSQGPKSIAEFGFDNCPKLDLLLVPGGFGTIRELNNVSMLDFLRKRAAEAEIVTSVCSGSALLAKAGLLDGRRATSNKQYFQFAVQQGPKVEWIKEARWVDDGDRVTSSGVSAGIDMALHVIARLYGAEVAENLANSTEYQWHRDANVDPFAKFAN